MVRQFVSQPEDIHSHATLASEIRGMFPQIASVGRYGGREYYGSMPHGGELYTITPTEPYTRADLDWHDKQSRSSVEMNDPKSRPAFAGKELNMTDYDVIFIGYPIWWDLAPRVVYTFIESHDLKGKTVIPFATSGGSTLGNSVAENHPCMD